jgi:curved DNA-binding protein CbpA
MTDYYEILRVHPTASNDEIKEAYRRLAHKHHPDMGGDGEQFKKVHEAYEVLSNPEKRVAYDGGLKSNQKENIVDAQYDVKLKQATYKIQNGDLAGAESILEEIAFSEGASQASLAWVYLGGIKLEYMLSGKSNASQALNCFQKAVQINPSEKTNYQRVFYNASIKLIQQMLNDYLEIQKMAKKAGHRALGGLALGGLSLLLGSQARRKNNTFGAMAGAAGGAYGGYRSLANHQQSKNAQQQLVFYNTAIKQLMGAVKSYCSDNQTVYQDYLNKIKQLGLSGWLTS